MTDSLSSTELRAELTLLQALERVRSRAQAMRRSDELAEVAAAEA